MTWIGGLWRQLRHRLWGARFDQDLAEEMRLHLDLRAADKQADGLAPDAARAAARRQFGNATRLQESSRAAWGWTLIDSWRQDIRYGLRTLVANPGFTATAVLSLALGIGANTAIFSILNAVLLRSLPVDDPQRLVQLRIGSEGDDELTNPIWEQVRDRQQAFSGALAYAPNHFDLADGGESHYALPCAGRAGHRGPRLHAGRRPARHGAGGGDQLQLPKAQFSGRGEPHRQDRAAQPAHV
jgi:hypothetical protein